MTRISSAVNMDFDNITVTVEGLDGLDKLLGADLVQKFGVLTNLAPATETVVASYTPVAGETVRVKGVFAEGENDGIVKLYIDGAVVWQGRNAWSERNVPILMEAEALATQVIELKITNLKNQNSDYSGGFYGYKI